MSVEIGHLREFCLSRAGGVAISGWAVSVDGMLSVSTYENVDGDDGLRKKQSADDLLRYLNEFVYAGCGGAEHVFDGDATDPLVALACKSCGAKKPLGLIHDPAELRTRMAEGAARVARDPSQAGITASNLSGGDGK